MLEIRKLLETESVTVPDGTSDSSTRGFASVGIPPPVPVALLVPVPVVDVGLDVPVEAFVDPPVVPEDDVAPVVDVALITHVLVAVSQV